METVKLMTLRRQLELLRYVSDAPEVVAAKEKVLEARKADIERVEAQIEELRAKRVKPKMRWPDSTPPEVIDECNAYWVGTTEYWTYRIHAWNEKAIWTSWPSGGYSTNGGWVKVKPCYFLICRAEKASDMGHLRAKVLKTIDVKDRNGKKVTEKELTEIMEEVTGIWG
jgi:hypothetical protein